MKLKMPRLAVRIQPQTTTPGIMIATGGTTIGAGDGTAGAEGEAEVERGGSLESPELPDTMYADASLLFVPRKCNSLGLLIELCVCMAA